MFGTFSRVCQGVFSECYTFDEMKEACARNGKLTFKPWEMTFQEHIMDWKSFLGIDLHVPSFEHITEHHAFKIGKAHNGDIQLLYKEWRQDKEWQGSLLHSTGVPIFHTDRLLEALQRLPRYIQPPLAVDPAVSETVTKLIRGLKSSGVATPSRIEWFERFQKISPPPAEIPDPVSLLLSPMPPIAEELQTPPVPCSNPAPARPIIAQAPRVAPELYTNRDPLVGELVVVEMHPEDRQQWPEYYFWIACVLHCPSNPSKSYKVLWYHKRNDKYKKAKNKKENCWKVKRSTILFSGFSLTSTNKLYLANERLFMAHDKVKQLM
jgi:hypothetical protein